MKIQIAEPGWIHGMGKRSNNEDNLFPQEGKATPTDRLFMVCDGVGGNEKGEIASEIACAAVPGYFTQNRVTVSNSQIIHDAVGFARSEIRKYQEENPGSESMATTLTLLHLHENGATVAHIGDSRIYHIRNGNILWKTHDHSYVNDLVKAGVITETEALTHPQRNVIMRALHGHDKETLADVHMISELQSGDYFFLCSDGILESVSDELLIKTLNSESSDTEKIRSLRRYCETGSNDNFTAYLVKIKSVENLGVELLPQTGTRDKKDSRTDKTSLIQNVLRGSLWVIISFLIVFGCWFFIRSHGAKPAESKPAHMETGIKKDSVISAKKVLKSAKFLVKIKSKKDSKPR